MGMELDYIYQTAVGRGGALTQDNPCLSLLLRNFEPFLKGIGPTPRRVDAGITVSPDSLPQGAYFELTNTAAALSTSLRVEHELVFPADLLKTNGNVRPLVSSINNKDLKFTARQPLGRLVAHFNPKNAGQTRIRFSVKDEE